MSLQTTDLNLKCLVQLQNIIIVRQICASFNCKTAGLKNREAHILLVNAILPLPLEDYHRETKQILCF